MPLREQFYETAEYYGTLFHEAVHSTGHESRLNRLEPGAVPAAFGSADYSKEELVAEIGSATILHEIKIETDSSFRNNTAYIQNWLGVLKGDKKFIVSAASRAEKAVNLILNIQQYSRIRRGRKESTWDSITNLSSLRKTGKSRRYTRTNTTMGLRSWNTRIWNRFVNAVASLIWESRLRIMDRRLF